MMMAMGPPPPSTMMGNPEMNEDLIREEYADD
jgi:hypothetical protein